jgi:glycerophosphoryl diester phosphodiesterase
MTPALPPAFLAAPIAHRALHGPGRAENSMAAVAAAVAAGYGIEIDVQLTQDGEAVVFHDEDLSRLTAEAGLVRARTRGRARRHSAQGGRRHDPAPRRGSRAGEGQSAASHRGQGPGRPDGPRGRRTRTGGRRDLARYDGPVAVMSFNPHTVDALRQHAPGVARGLVTCSWRAEDWPDVPEPDRARLRGIPDFVRTGASFISHEAADLNRPRVAELKAAGVPVLCWTIRSPAAEVAARKVADNVTFEGYRPAVGRLDGGAGGSK